MASHPRHKVERKRCPGVVHLELWDALVDGRTLFAWRDHPGFPERLAHVVEHLIAGTLVTASAFAFPEACRAIASVWVAGGRHDTVACAARLSWPTHLSAHGPFAGARGGLSLLEGRPGAVVDLGQTSAKVMRADGTPRRIEREGRGWEEVLRAALAGEAFGSSRLVLGLPAELSASGAGPCSYFDALSWEELADKVPCDTVVVTDAELAALAARADLRVVGLLRNDCSPGLSLTLGHGVGAALVWDAP